jgi:hypothetical protein
MILLCHGQYYYDPHYLPRPFAACDVGSFPQLRSAKLAATMENNLISLYGALIGSNPRCNGVPLGVHHTNLINLIMQIYIQDLHEEAALRSSTAATNPFSRLLGPCARACRIRSMERSLLSVLRITHLSFDAGSTTLILGAPGSGKEVDGRASKTSACKCTSKLAFLLSLRKYL